MALIRQIRPGERRRIIGRLPVLLGPDEELLLHAMLDVASDLVGDEFEDRVFTRYSVLTGFREPRLMKMPNGKWGYKLFDGVGT